MARRKIGKGISYGRLLQQPAAAFRRMRQRAIQEVKLTWAVLGGCCMVLLWADLFNLGSVFGEGPVMSVALVGGPPIGIAFLVLSTSLSLVLAHLLLRTPAPTLAFRPTLPPFPLKNLLWRRLLGTARLQRLFAWPVLKQAAALWNFLQLRLRQLAYMLHSGKTNMTALLAWNSLASMAWLPIAGVLWTAHFILDQALLMPGSPALLLWLVLPLGGVGLLAYHCAVALRVGLGLRPLQALLVLGLAWAMSLGLLLFLFSFFIGISLF